LTLYSTRIYFPQKVVIVCVFMEFITEITDPIRSTNYFTNMDGMDDVDDLEDELENDDDLNEDDEDEFEMEEEEEEDDDEI